MESIVRGEVRRRPGAFNSDNRSRVILSRGERAGNMTKTRRMRITIQTERLLMMNRGRNEDSLCPSCSSQVRMVTVDQAASMSGVNSREIYRRIEAGKLHFIETSEGSLLLCFNSMNQTNQTKKDE